ncbi:MAG: hypothetical protein VB081_10065 [Christensenella sp.]|uniref:hypothetical protein n=1 Tax=Christensenella sp. TaxID=1935934 RepID=UPI002B21AA95|nr:hypothetical protein [Christensenella sp.]MEA5003831.1 hypothetical protein [Christensenella sp.]
MLNEFLDEIRALKEYKTKYEYAQANMQRMSDELYKLMLAEYERTPYEERLQRFYKKTCRCCRHHCSEEQAKATVSKDVLKPKESNCAWIPARSGCKEFEWD